MDIWKRRAVIIAAAIVSILSFGAVVFWIFTDPFTVIADDPSKTDYWESVVDTAVIKNSHDFFIWYKFNITLQVISIFCGVMATIVASVTTKENANTIKYVTIGLTGVTAVIVAFQSVFHIRDNLTSFIEVNSRLTTLGAKHRLEVKSLETTKKTLEQVEQETAQEFASIQEIRWRAYGNIGQIPDTYKRPPSTQTTPANGTADSKPQDNPQK